MEWIAQKIVGIWPHHWRTTCVWGRQRNEAMALQLKWLVGNEKSNRAQRSIVNIMFDDDEERMLPGCMIDANIIETIRKMFVEKKW